MRIITPNCRRKSILSLTFGHLEGLDPLVDAPEAHTGRLVRLGHLVDDATKVLGL